MRKKDSEHTMNVRQRGYAGYRAHAGRLVSGYSPVMTTIIANKWQLKRVSLLQLASTAVCQGMSSPMIAALLGHKNVVPTQQYVHLQDDPLKKHEPNDWR